MPTGPSAEVLQRVLRELTDTGFQLEPWLLAAFVAAARTKPFLILAGISGTGKSLLPTRVASVTGASRAVAAVTPAWTDSSELIGYTDLEGTFRPDPFLKVARDAAASDQREHFFLLDEMNLARVEHYFAEALSGMEERSNPLVQGVLPDAAADEWGGVTLPPNLLVVGTVNMDESTHGFSRKVLDRAFTIEMSSPDLAKRLGSLKTPGDVADLGSAAWAPVARRVALDAGFSDEQNLVIDRAIEVLKEINRLLRKASLQVGLRVRDELSLFLVHALPLTSLFEDGDGNAVDPLDLGLLMKILPRIEGGSAAISRLLTDLLGWCSDGDDETLTRDELVAAWRDAGHPEVHPTAGLAYPRTTARLCLMWDRLESEGFTSYWL